MSATYKVCILGACAVGKSSIAQRYVNDKYFEFNEPTIGAAFLKKTINDVCLEIWDTAGQERYQSLAPMYYRGANAVLVVYDLSDLSTVNSAKQWIQQLKEKTNDYIPIIIVGNKCDLVNINKPEFDLNFPHFSVSAKNNINIDRVFECLIKEIKQNIYIQKKEPKIVQFAKKKESPNFKCC